MRQAIRTVVWGGLLILAAGPAGAVKTASWRHEQPEEFNEGTFEQTAVSSRGEVLLGRAVSVLHEAQEGVEAVNALARGPDGAVYAVTSGDGTIFRVSGSDVKTFVKLPDKNVYSLLFTVDGMLLAGTGGEKARIFRIDRDGRAQVFHEPQGARYVWAMVRGESGEVFAATGVEGKLYRIEPDGGKAKVLYDARQKNLLCLAVDETGMLYCGTDTDGVIYRIDPSDGRAYALYDAEEAEISSIAIGSDRAVYAATAAAAGAKPGRDLGGKAGGRPERPTTTTAPAGRAISRPGPAAAAESVSEMVQAMTGRRPAPGTGPAGAENAIYRIDRDGIVTEVFREPVMILAIAEAGGTVYAATGNEGRIYEIQPQQEVSVAVAKLKSAQVVSLLRLEDDRLLVGTANAAAIVRLDAGYARNGTYLSPVLDAKQIARFGRVRWRAEIPEGTRLTLATRSGNVKDPDNGPWDAWSAEVDATAGVQIASPSARFFQYRLTFTTTDPQKTPRLGSIEIARIEDNQRPEITTLEAGFARKVLQIPALQPLKAKLGGLAAMAAGAGGGDVKRDPFVIAWAAEDPNGDSLVYEIYFRQVGHQRWVRLDKEDLKDTLKIWDTRTVSDGLYEVKVVAKDTPDNPVNRALTYSRTSDPVLIDNTPPAVEFDRVEASGRKVEVRALVRDALSPVTAARYTVDSADEWKALAPADDLFDSLQETLEFTIEELEAGEHRLVVAAEDEQGNTVYATRAVTIGP